MMIASNTEKVLGVIVILLFVLFLLSACTGTSKKEADTEVFYCVGACIHVIQDVEIETEIETESKNKKVEKQ